MFGDLRRSYGRSGLKLRSLQIASLAGSPIILKGMQYWILLVLSVLVPAFAQPKPPLGIVFAELKSWDGSWDGGVLLLKLDSGIDYECAFDGKTFFERERSRISVGRLRPGDHLEIMSDRTTQSSRCFARMVKASTIKPGGPPTWGQVTRATEHFAPRGNLTYNGTVVEVEEHRLVVRIRGGSRQSIRLRSDTRYVLNGLPSTRDIMTMNATIHVRAGHGLDEEIEAYQVVAGEILQPIRGGTRQQ